MFGIRNIILQSSAFSAIVVSLFFEKKMPMERTKKGVLFIWLMMFFLRILLCKLIPSKMKLRRNFFLQSVGEQRHLYFRVHHHLRIDVLMILISSRPKSTWACRAALCICLLLHRRLAIVHSWKELIVNHWVALCMHMKQKIPRKMQEEGNVCWGRSRRKICVR